MKNKKFYQKIFFLIVFLFYWANPGYAWWYKTGPHPEISDLERRIKIYEEMLTIVEHQKRNLAKQQESLNARKKVIIHTISAKEDELQKVQEEISQRQAVSAKKPELPLSQIKKMEEECARRINGLKSELLEERVKLKETERLVRDKENQLHVLDEKYNALAQKPKKDQEQIALIKKQNQALSRSNESMKKEISEKERLIGLFQEENKKLASQPDDYEEKLLLAELRQDGLKASYDLLEGLLAEKEEALDELSQRLSQQKYEIQEKDFMLDSKKDEIAEVAQDLKFYKKQSDKVDFVLQQKNEDMIAMRKELLELKQDLVMKQRLIIAKNKEILALKNRLVSSEYRVQEVLRQRDSFLLSLKEDLRKMHNSPRQ